MGIIVLSVNVGIRFDTILYFSEDFRNALKRPDKIPYQIP